LDSYNDREGTASVNSIFDGRITLRSDSEVLKKSLIYGLNESELDAFLMSLNNIAGYEVEFSPKFFPTFLKKVPNLPDRIEVKVEN